MSEFVYITGKLKHARLVTPETDPWGNTKWKIVVYPDAESLPKVMDMQASGVKNLLKKDDDGYYVNYNRPFQKKDSKGRVSTFTPVEVVDKDGKQLDGMTIGNGSVGTAKIEIYSHPTPTGGRANAARLCAVKVTELVPYERAAKPDDKPKQEQGF